MPKGPSGQKRPADAIGTAVMVGRIATGEIPDEIKASSGKVRSGRAGGLARSRSLTAEQKSSVAKKAAEKRWNLESAMSNMSGTEKLTALLFNEGRELANIKFFPGSKKGLTVDELHGAAADAIRSAIEGGLINSPPMSGLAKSRLA